MNGDTKPLLLCPAVPGSPGRHYQCDDHCNCPARSVISPVNQCGPSSKNALRSRSERVIVRKKLPARDETKAKKKVVATIEAKKEVVARSERGQSPCSQGG